MGPLLLGLEALRIERIRFSPQAVVLDLSIVADSSNCPECGQRSIRIHSRYCRHPCDLPAHGRAVRLNLHVRRFFCDHPDCPRQTFAERIPAVAQQHARRTCRLEAALQDIAFACGGEKGAKLAGNLAMPTSADTLLRVMRSASGVPCSVPHVLGVDDWAIRRGQRYGTILCDLELHKPIELLPERSSGVLADWLEAHPGTEVIARDRGGEYARGAEIGAPDAIQVADRWHLLHNLHEALERALDRRHAMLSGAATQTAAAPVNSEPPPPVALTNSIQPAYLQRRQEERRGKRLACFEQVKQLQLQGMTQRQIAVQLKLDRGTVRRLSHADSFPERAASPRRGTKLDRFLPELRARWDAGCHNGRKLFRELRAQGYTGSYPSVRRKLQAWLPAKPDETAVDQPNKRHQAIRRPSAKTASWWLLKDTPAQAVGQQAFVAALHRLWPELGENIALIQEFSDMLRERDTASLEAWVQLAEGSAIFPEIRKFARVLRRDWAAVLEAVRGQWSSGQVEGQINRLKLIKREMYGRANFDLLRQRVLHSD